MKLRLVYSDAKVFQTNSLKIQEQNNINQKSETYVQRPNHEYWTGGGNIQYTGHQVTLTNHRETDLTLVFTNGIWCFFYDIFLSAVLVNHCICFTLNGWKPMNSKTEVITVKTQTCTSCMLFLQLLILFSSSFSLCLPLSLSSRTVFLRVSCLESQPAGQLRPCKFVSGRAVEREATCSEGSALTRDLFLTVDPWLFQARPLWRHNHLRGEGEQRPHRHRGLNAETNRSPLCLTCIFEYALLSLMSVLCICEDSTSEWLHSFSNPWPWPESKTPPKHTFHCKRKNYLWTWKGCISVSQCQKHIRGANRLGNQTSDNQKTTNKHI